MRRWLKWSGLLVATLVGTVWLTWPSDDAVETPTVASAPKTTKHLDGAPEPSWPLDDHPRAQVPLPPAAPPLEADDDQPAPPAHLDVLVTSAEGVIEGATVTLTQDDMEDAAGEPACPCTGGSELRLSDPSCGDCPELVSTVLTSVRSGETFSPLVARTTNKFGQASIDLPSPTPRLSAWIEAPGYTPVSAGPFLPLNLHIEVALHRPVRDGYRVLAPDGWPLPHAATAAFSTHPYRAYAPRREGDVFWFDGVPSEYVLVATGGEAGLLPVMARAANRAHPDGGTIDDLTLESGWRLRAVVTRGGQPVRSTPVELVCNDRHIPVATDAHGRFEVWPAPAGGCDLLARAEGQIARADYAPETMPEQTTFDIALNLAAAGSIEGSVIDEKTGSPQAGVPVALMGSDASATSGQLNREFISTETDAAGRFQFDDLAPGDFDVLAAITGEVQTTKVASGQRATVTLRITSLPNSPDAQP